MPAAHSEFVRQTPRAPLLCPVTVRLDSGHQLVGEALDISTTGMAVRTDRRLRAGERVSLRIDAHPGGQSERNFPALGGTITGVTRSGHRDDRALYRVGIAFAALPAPIGCQVRELAERLAARGVTNDHAAVGPHLAQDPAGRERLFQLALERLAEGDHAGAREAVRTSLRVIPHARHMRVLLCRIDAEAALSELELDEARRRVRHGRGLSPDDPMWRELDGRIRAADRARRPLWSRLFH